MTRTDLDPTTLARSLRRMAGDGSVEWVMEPIQADVLRDIADMLDDIDATAMRQGDADLAAENAKLRELAKRMHCQIKQTCDGCDGYYCSNFDEDNECCVYDTLLRELGMELDA